MKATKAKKYFTIFIVMIICIAMVFGIAACTPTIKESEVDVSGEDTANVKNGNFERASGTTYPLTPESWTASPGQTGGSSATPTDEDSIINGVISVDENEYNSNKRRWGNLDNPGTHEGAEGDRMLMIYNKVDNAYRYTLSSITLTKGKYYLLTMWVKTVNVEGFGASVYVTNSAYGEVKNIDTQSQWVQYSFYIESSVINDYSINLSIGLGEGGLSDGKLAKGYAFFDDIFLNEIDAATYNSATENDYTQKYTLTLPDRDFDYINSSSTQPYSLSSSYTALSGEDVSTGSSYVTRGIVDTSLSDASVFSKKISIDGSSSNTITIPAIEPMDAAQSSRMLLIASTNATTMTTVGYRSTRQMRFSFGENNYYKLSIRVASYICEGAGAYIKLTEGSNDKSDKYQISDIVTNGEWSVATFYIQSNQVRNRDFYIEFWLGDGGNLETGKLSRGYAFFDYITLEEINEEEFNTRPTTSLSCTVDLTDDTENLIKTDFTNGTNGDYFVASSYVDENDETVIRDNIATYEFITTTAWDANKYSDISNPLSPTDASSYICIIHHSEPTITKLNYSENGNIYPFAIVPNRTYRIALWVKTEKALSKTGISVNIIKEEDGKQTTVTNISDFNSADNTINEAYNGYTELVFYIEGSTLTNSDDVAADTVNIGIEILFGNGSKYNSAKFAKGYAFIANVNMQEISYSEYSNATTSSTVIKKSLSETSPAVSNGGFDSIDKTDTEFDINGYPVRYEEDDVDKLNPEYILGNPTNWSETDENENFDAGIINKNNTNLVSKYNLGTNIYNGYPFEAGAPNFMFIGANSAIIEGTSAYGYSLNSGNKISLSSNSYYKVTVWLKLYKGTASIVIKNSTDSKETVFKITQSDASLSADNVEFKQYDLYVEVGMTSASLTVSVYLGDYSSTSNTYSADDRLIFDSVQYITIDSEKFNNAVTSDTVKKESYVVDGFDTTSDYSETTSTVSPSGWTGALVDSNASSSSSDLKSGVLSKEHSFTENWLTSEELSQIFGTFSHEITDGDRTTTETLDTGNYVLVIDGLNPTTYKYTTSSSTTFSSGTKQYEVSVWVMTQNIEGEKGAFIRLLINKKTYTFENINTEGQWKKYTFMVQTSANKSLSSIYIALGIGDTGEENYVKGRAFFDNVTLREVTDVKVGESTYFDYVVPAETVENEEGEETSVTEKFDTNYKMRLVFTDDLSVETETEPEDNNTPTNDYFWLIISSAVVGGIIILVVLVYYGRKLYIKQIKPRMKKKKEKANYNIAEEDDKNDKHLDEFKDKE